MTARLRADISVASLGDLAQAWVAPLREGCLAWVEVELDYFKLEKSSGAASDGINIIAPIAGAPSAGASGARWVRLSSSGSGGTGLAFLNIAEMAAFPVAPLTKGATAEVLSLEDIWNYDPTSTLVPDVSAGSPLGRTIVAANGVGNWLRDRHFASLRWREQVFWHLDPANALAGDENDGGTALTPLFSIDELMDRLTGLAESSTGYDVTVSSDVLSTVVVDMTQKSGVNAIYFHGPLTAIAFGAAASAVVDAAVDWAPAVPTPATITVNALPVSWTASGMIGKLVVVIASANPARVGNTFQITEETGGDPKTAYISDVSAGVFTVSSGVVAAGDTIQVYDLVQLGTLTSAQVAGGEGAQVDFQYLILGDDDAHAFEVRLGASLIDSCIVHGINSSGGSAIQMYNCVTTNGCRAEYGSFIQLVHGYTTGVDARPSGNVELLNLVTYGTILIQQNAVVKTVGNGWVCSRGMATAWVISPGGLLDAYTSSGYLFGAGVTTNAFIIQAGGRVVFDHNKPPQYAGTPNPVSLGAMAPIAFAQLPYTSPIDGACMVEGNAPNATEDQFAVQAADVSPAGAAAAVLTLAFTVNGLRDCIIHTACGFMHADSTNGLVQLWIDGVSVQSFGVGGIAGLAGLYGRAAHLWKAQLAAGAHTASVAASTAAGQLFFRAATQPLAEGSSIVVRELNG
jgi:hypothetical protein